MTLLIMLIAAIAVYRRFFGFVGTVGLAAYTLYIAYMLLMVPVNYITGNQQEVSRLEMNSQVKVSYQSHPIVDRARSKIAITGTIQNNSRAVIKLVRFDCRYTDMFATKSRSQQLRQDVNILPGQSVTLNLVSEEFMSTSDGNAPHVADHFCRFDRVFA